MILELSKSYPSRYGRPILTAVDTAIWSTSGFGDCTACTFCNDGCCAYGVDISVDEVRRLDGHAKELETLTGVPRTEWFDKEEIKDEEFPGQRYTLTQTNSRGCVFLNPAGRGCMIHSFCLQNGMDYHELKPMVSCLFPLTFDRGLLMTSLDVQDKIVVCLGDGPSLYQIGRTELEYYFGPDLICELDALERTALTASPERAQL